MFFFGRIILFVLFSTHKHMMRSTVPHEECAAIDPASCLYIYTLYIHIQSNPGGSVSIRCAAKSSKPLGASIWENIHVMYNGHGHPALGRCPKTTIAERNNRCTHNTLPTANCEDAQTKTHKCILNCCFGRSHDEHTAYTQIYLVTNRCVLTLHLSIFDRYA